MKYYITNVLEAEQISRQEAIDRGCEGTTMYWYQWQTNPNNPDECALILPEDYSGTLETVNDLPITFNEEITLKSNENI